MGYIGAEVVSEIVLKLFANKIGAKIDTTPPKSQFNDKDTHGFKNKIIIGICSALSVLAFVFLWALFR
ncbi:hypothetical protein ASB1_05830 [Helicobacter heilmannii]|nr:hypothetical protein ASB1_05830 [Helicobacter heilmannii]